MNKFLVAFLVATVALSTVSSVPVDKKTVSTDSEADAEEEASVEETAAPANVTAAPDMAQAMAGLMRAFKKVMPCGDSSLKIPVLAPFRLANIPIDIEEELLTLKGSVKNLVVTGSNDFVIINMATNSTTNRTSFDVLFTGFQTLGHFDIAVNADLAGYRFIQTLKGMMDVQLLNVRVNGGMTFGVSKSGGIVVSDVDVYVQVGQALYQTLESEWSVAVNNFVNKLQSDVLMIFMQTNRELVNQMISDYITPIINKALYSIPLSEYIESLVEATELYNSIDCSP